MVDYSRDEIERKIDELGRETPWFHNIELPGGIFTKKSSQSGEPVNQPRDQWAVLRKHFPDRLDGKSVLDIGCNAGFFSFEMAKRGAVRVVGIDMVPGYVEQARFCNEVLGLGCEFRQMNVYDLAANFEPFDVVLCLGVIYHCKHPTLVAEQVSAVCREWSIVESALTADVSLLFERIWTKALYMLRYRKAVGDRSYRKANSFMRMVCDPREPGAREDKGVNWWFPNMPALQGMFLASGFDTAEVLHKSFSRGAILCRKQAAG